MAVSPSEVPSTGLHRAPPAAAPAAAPSSGPPPVRAQILATEHWSLLATRSMTWSEVMSRITIHLTIASASLVVLALFAQASGFGTAFHVMAIGLAAAVLLLGLLTSHRVMNASTDDAKAVLGMNRLRAAYLELDPGLAPYLVTSAHDDAEGLMATYLMGTRRSTVSHVVASTAIFVTVVNAIVAGTLGALVASAASAASWGVAVVGVLCGLVLLGVHLEQGRRTFGRQHIDAHFPSPADDATSGTAPVD